MSKVSDAVRALAACPRCRAPIDTFCHTRTSRNHTERIHDAIRIALGLPPEAEEEAARVRDLTWRDR